MDCTTQIQHWFYICLSLIGLILFLVAMFMNYNLKLDKRTIKLEKKNGHEQHQIDEIRKEVEKLKTSKFKSSQKLKETK